MALLASNLYMTDAKTKTYFDLEFDGSAVVYHQNKLFFYGGHHKTYNNPDKYLDTFRTLNLGTKPSNLFYLILSDYFQTRKRKVRAAQLQGGVAARGSCQRVDGPRQRHSRHFRWAEDR